MSKAVNYTPWLQSILTIAKHYRIEVSEEQIRLHLDWNDQQDVMSIVALICRQIGLQYRWVDFSEASLNPWLLPVIVEFYDGQVGVVDRSDQYGQYNILFSADLGLSQTIIFDQLQENVKRILIVRPEASISDVRVDEYIKPYESNWFWTIALRDWRRYIDIMFASLIANVLALATIIFSMQVYDRVVPSQSIPTLWVLAGGVLIAALFEFILRISRIYLSDLIGKRADLKISDKVFGHALRIKNNERSKSTGSFISQIRELEGVRELITSTTIGAIADLPFFFLFLAVFWMIGGNLFWVMVAIVPLMIVPGVLVQKKLAQLAQEGMRESLIRNAMLVEVVQGIEDIKLLRAESKFQNQWNHVNDVAATISMSQRKIVGFLTTWTQKIQSLTYAIIVFVGCFSVMDGEMTTGALVACSILSSRMLMPFSQITTILARLQQAKVAKLGLDELMKKNVDQPDHTNLIHKAAIYGYYDLSDISFKYNKEDQVSILQILKLEIKAGEKIAILGRNGAGKSTLLQLLAGMQSPQGGKISVDGIDISLLDPMDTRRDIGLLNQNAQLFFGSIRENLILGMPLASDEDIFNALRMTGALDFVLSKKDGLDHLILEGGGGFSCGQKQALLLARVLIRNPNVLLLDEPTSSFDDVSEKLFIDHLKHILKNETVVIATHRKAILELVDRVIIINGGQVVMDGPKDEIINSLIAQNNK